MTELFESNSTIYMLHYSIHTVLTPAVLFLSHQNSTYALSVGGKNVFQAGKFVIIQMTRAAACYFHSQSIIWRYIGISWCFWYTRAPNASQDFVFPNTWTFLAPLRLFTLFKFAQIYTTWYKHSKCRTFQTDAVFGWKYYVCFEGAL